MARSMAIVVTGESATCDDAADEANRIARDAVTDDGSCEILDVDVVQHRYRDAWIGKVKLLLWEGE